MKEGTAERSGSGAARHPGTDLPPFRRSAIGALAFILALAACGRSGSSTVKLPDRPSGAV